MRIIIGCLLLVLIGLQYKLWVGDGGIYQWRHINKKLVQQKQNNLELALNNDAIANEVMRLQEGPEALEEKARYELGMIKQGELYYHFVE